MKACEFTASITAIACLIAKDKECDEVALLAAFFSQLGDTLATMVAFDEACCPSEGSTEGSTKESTKESTETTLGAIV